MTSSNGTGKKFQDRILCDVQGNSPGPLIVCLAGLHGNEKAGIKALGHIGASLDPKKHFFSGRFVGIAGNLEAIKTGARFIDKDLNRVWSKESILRHRKSSENKFKFHEDREQRDLIQLIDSILEAPHTTSLFIDLHTTSAFGGVFSIANSYKRSMIFGSTLNNPVIIGLSQVLEETSLHYFDLLGVPGIGFEAGQHKSPASINNIIGAIYIILAGAGCMHSVDIPGFQQFHKHLYHHGRGLPRVVRFIYKYKISDNEGFEMYPGFLNFQKVKKGDLIAKNNSGDIVSEYDGMILMPLYQKQGSDGFFIVEAVSDKESRDFGV